MKALTPRCYRFICISATYFLPLRIFCILFLLLCLPDKILGQYDNVVINETSGDGGNVEAGNDAIVELAGPPGTDIGCMVITNTEWAVVLPRGTTIPADGVFSIGCAVRNNMSTGFYTGIHTGLSCGVCDFPGLVLDFDVCSNANANYVSTSVYSTYGFTLDNQYCGGNRDGDQVILFRPDGMPHDALYWGAPEATDANGGATTSGGAAGTCGSSSDHVSVQIGQAYTLGDNDENGIINDYTGTHIGYKANGGNAVGVNRMPSGNDDIGSPELFGSILAIPPGDCHADNKSYTVPPLTDPIWVNVGLTLVSCNSTHIRINDTSPTGNSHQQVQASTTSSHMDDPDLNMDWAAYTAASLMPSSISRTQAASQWQVTNHPNPGLPNDADSWDFFYDIGGGMVEIADKSSLNLALCNAQMVSFMVKIYNYQHVEPTIRSSNKAGSFVQDETGTDQAWTVVSVGSSTTNGSFSSSEDGVTTFTFTSSTLSVGSDNTFTLVWDDFTDCCGSGNNSTVVNRSNPHECYEKIEVNIAVGEAIAVSDNNITCPGDFVTNIGTIDFSQFVTSNHASINYVLKEGVSSGSEISTGAIVSSNNTGIFNLPNTLIAPIAVILENQMNCGGTQVMTIGKDCRSVPPCPEPKGAAISATTVCPEENFTLSVNGTTSTDLPNGGTIDWYYGSAGFDPLAGEGTLLGKSTITTSSTSPSSNGPAINEVLVDADANDGAGGEFIELAGKPGTDLSCYILTDGDAEIVLPSGTSIPADGYLLIAASTTTNAPVSAIDVDLSTCGCFSGTNLVFSNESSSGGEFLFLYDPSGGFVDGVLWGNPSASSKNHPDGNGSESVGVSVAACSMTPASVTTSGQSYTNAGITSTPNGVSIELDTDVSGTWQNTNDAAGFTPGASNSGAIPTTSVANLVTSLGANLCGQTLEIKGIVQPATLTGTCTAADITTTSFSLTIECPEANLQPGDKNYCLPVSATEILATTAFSGGSGTYDVTIQLIHNGVSTNLVKNNATNPLRLTYDDISTALGISSFTDLELNLLRVSDAGGNNCDGKVSSNVVILTVQTRPEGKIATTTDLSNCTGSASGKVVFEFRPANSGPWAFEYSVNGGASVEGTANTTPFSLPVSIVGDYQLTQVANNTGCAGTIDNNLGQFVSAPAPLSITAVTDPDAICPGTGSVDLMQAVTIGIGDNGISQTGTATSLGNIIWYAEDPSGLPSSIRSLIALSGIATTVSPNNTQPYYFIYTRSGDNCEVVGSTTIRVEANACNSPVSNQPATQPAPQPTPATPQPATPMPTMSQWGLIIFALLVLNLGVFFVQRLQTLYLEIEGQTLIPIQTDLQNLFQLFIKILLGIALVFLFAILFFDYEWMPFDGPGSIITAILLAYFIQNISLKS